MNKPEPLFPSTAKCPGCGKKIRVKWALLNDLAPGLTGLGQMKCPHCRASHMRAVGPEEAIQGTARIFAAKVHEACGHDHGHEGHDHNHGIAVIPGNDQFAYIKLPG